MCIFGNGFIYIGVGTMTFLLIALVGDSIFFKNMHLRLNDYAKWQANKISPSRCVNHGLNQIIEEIIEIVR